MSRRPGAPHQDAVQARMTRGPLDTMEPKETGLDWYLCRVCDIIPVGRWKLKLPSQDLVEEIFLQIVLTVSDKDMEEEPKSPDRFLTKRSWEEWGEESILFGLGSSYLHCIFPFTQWIKEHFHRPGNQTERGRRTEKEQQREETKDSRNLLSVYRASAWEDEAVLEMDGVVLAH